jgi:hypothetical protein
VCITRVTHKLISFEPLTFVTAGVDHTVTIPDATASPPEQKKQKRRRAEDSDDEIDWLGGARAHQGDPQPQQAPLEQAAEPLGWMEEEMAALLGPQAQLELQAVQAMVAEANAEDDMLEAEVEEGGAEQATEAAVPEAPEPPAPAPDLGPGAEWPLERALELPPMDSKEQLCHTLGIMLTGSWHIVPTPALAAQIKRQAPLGRMYQAWGRSFKCVCALHSGCNIFIKIVPADMGAVEMTTIKWQCSGWGVSKETHLASARALKAALPRSFGTGAASSSNAAS